MPDPYTFIDPDGDTLTISRSAATSAVRLIATDTASGQQVYLTLPNHDLDDFVSAMYRAAGRRPGPLDAARLTTFFADATDEEISAFLARFEITERTAAPADLEASRAGAYQAGGDDL
jgi:hypothetical protein